MTDLARDIGALGARMDEHEKRVNRIEGKIDEGFAAVTLQLNNLTAAENKRQGARATWTKIISGAIGVAGAWEAIKAIWHH
jgi:hypothetical protein